jgi:hypothetical protein
MKNTQTFFIKTPHQIVDRAGSFPAFLIGIFWYCTSAPAYARHMAGVFIADF